MRLWLLLKLSPLLLLQAILLSIRLKDKLKNENGEEVMLDEPTGFELPPNGFDVEDAGYQAPAEDGSTVQVVVKPDSQRFNCWSHLQHGKAPILKD